VWGGLKKRRREKVVNKTWSSLFLFSQIVVFKW
jgi:hypothetical protein